MLNNTLISVIVTVYNISEYIDRCVDSIVAQDYRDIEVILVDDGSNDGSGEKCDAWSKKDVRVRVVHKANGGLSSARNAGIDAANGDWVRFVDGDDVLPCRSLSVMMSAVSEGVCFVSGRFSEFTDRLPVIKRRQTGSICIMDSRTALADMLYQHHISSSACDKIFQKQLVESVRFKEGILYEDLEWMARLIPLCDRIAVIPDIVYFYRKRPGSIISTFNPGRLDVLAVTREINDRLSCNGELTLTRAASDRELSANFNMFLILNKHGMGKDAVASDCWQRIKRLRGSSLFDSRVRLKNKVGILLSFFGKRLFSRFTFMV